MRGDSLARFGRWSFYAGWLIGICITWAGVTFDLPWWATGGISFAVAVFVTSVINNLATAAQRGDGP